MNNSRILLLPLSLLLLCAHALAAEEQTDRMQIVAAVWITPGSAGGKEVLIEPDADKIRAHDVTFEQLSKAIHGTRFVEGEWDVEIGDRHVDISSLASLTVRKIEAKPFSQSLPDGRKVTVTPNSARIGHYIITAEDFETCVRRELSAFRGPDPAKCNVLSMIVVPGNVGPHLTEEGTSRHLSLGEPLETFAKLAVVQGNLFENPTPADIPALIANFGDPDVRLGASKAIVQIGKPSVRHLIGALTAGDEDVTTWSVYTLGQIGPDASDAVALVAKFIESDDHDLRSVAVRAIGQIGSADADTIKGLAEATADKNERVRRWSIVSLGQLGPQAAAAVPELVDALDDQTVRAEAIHALVEIGSVAIPTLKDSLSDDNVRLEVAAVIRRVDSSLASQLGLNKPSPLDLTALQKSLNNVKKDAPARADAARRLGNLGMDGAPILVAAFEDADREIVRACSAAFRHIGAPAVSQLREAIKHDSAQVRSASIAALGEIGEDAQNAVPDIVAALQDADRGVRHEAVISLDAIGIASDAVVTGLVAVMQNERDREPTRQLAVKSLARRAPQNPKAIAGLRESTKDRNYGVSSLAKEVLKRIDAKAP